MIGLQTIQSGEESRILCISNRLIDPVISRCLRFEFEDVVSSVDHVDLAGHARPRIASSKARRAIGWLDGRLPTGQRRSAPGRYKLLFFGAQRLSDFAPLVPWSTSLPAAEKRACYIEDLYVQSLQTNRRALQVLRHFDAIFVVCEQTVEPLAKATGRPCYCLPASVDTLALCPFPNPPSRVIDFYSMGRRPPNTHEALMRMADRGDWFYHFDSVTESFVTNHVEHRRRLGDLLKRSKYFLVNPAMCNDPLKTGGQREMGFRYFEGAAAGTVMIGDLPDGRATSDYLGWRDAVVPLEYDSADIEQVLRNLESDPERVDRVRRSNVANCLRLNDHVHRWGEILRIMGLPETPEMEQRRRILNDMADQIERAIPPTSRASSSPPLGRAAGVGSPIASPKQANAGVPLEHLDSGKAR